MNITIAQDFPIYRMKKTESGDFSNLAILIKKDFAPKSLKLRYDKFFKPDENNVFGERAEKSLYRLEYQDIPAEEKQLDEEEDRIFFENQDGEKCLYCLSLVNFLKKHIKKFSLRFATGGYDPPECLPAAVYSGDSLAGFIMPVRQR